MKEFNNLTTPLVKTNVQADFSCPEGIIVKYDLQTMMRSIKMLRRKSQIISLVCLLVCMAFNLNAQSIRGTQEPVQFRGGGTLNATCDLTVKINGNTVYSGGAAAPSVTIKSGSTLSFNLSWTVTDPRYIIQDEDELVFPILSMSNPGYLQILPPSIVSLKINNVEVAVGYFEWAGDVLQYRVTFNSAAKNYIIGGGNIYGSAQFKYVGALLPFDLYFEDSAMGKITSVIPDPPDPGGDPGGPYSGPTGQWEEPRPPRRPYDIEKGLLNPRSQHLTLTSLDTKIQSGTFPYNDGTEYYGFTWVVPFYGLQKRYEANPDALATDYVIMEDIISANMRFAGFFKSGDYQRDHTFGFSDVPPSDPRYVWKNFFAVSVDLGAFNFEGGYSADDIYPDMNTNAYTYLFAHTAEMQQWEFTDKSVSFAPYSDVETAVRNTPFSYALVDLPDGRQKLIVNVGKFGNGIPPGEGIKANQFGQFNHVSNYATTRSCIEGLNNFLRWQETPYYYLMGNVDKLGVLLRAKADEVLVQYPTLTAYLTQFGSDHSYWTKVYESIEDPEVFDNFKAQLAAELKYGYLWETYGTSSIEDKYCFTERPSGDPFEGLKRFLFDSGTEINNLAKGIDLMLKGNVWGQGNYNERMTKYINGDFDHLIDGYLNGMLFHFPRMKEYFNQFLNLGFANPKTAPISQMAAAIKQLLYPGSPTFAQLRAEYIMLWNNNLDNKAESFPPGSTIVNYLPVLKKEGLHPDETHNDYAAHPENYNIAVSAVHLWYRTILIDENEAEFSNDVKVSTKSYEIETKRIYKHSFNAGIWGHERGEIGLIKADRYANRTTDAWRSDISAVDFTKIVQGIEDAEFEVYEFGTNVLLSFEKTVDENGISVYTVNNSGITTVTTGKGGTLKLTGLPDEIYLKEIGASGYYTGVQSGKIDVSDGNNVAMFDRPSGVALRKFNADETLPLNGAVFNVYKNDGGTWTQLPGGFTKRTVEYGRIAYWYEPNGLNKDLTTDYRLSLSNYPAHVDNAGYIYVFGLPEGEYKFVETQPPYGYELPDTPVEVEFTITISPINDATTTNDITCIIPEDARSWDSRAPTYNSVLDYKYVSLTNIPKSAPEIKVFKVGVPETNLSANGIPVSDIGFKLVKTSNFNNDWNSVPEKQTGSDGYAIWNSADIVTLAGSDDFAGTYMLVESTPPSGITPIDPIMFNISADGQVINVQLGSNDPQLVSFTNQTGSVEFKIKNAIDETIVLIEGKKKVTGENIPNQIFTFELTQVEGFDDDTPVYPPYISVLPATVPTYGEGSYAFSFTLTNLMEDTYYVKITEMDDDVANWEYSTVEYILEIVVDASSAKIVSQKSRASSTEAWSSGASYTGNIGFTNHYFAEICPSAIVCVKDTVKLMDLMEDYEGTLIFYDNDKIPFENQEYQIFTTAGEYYFFVQAVIGECEGALVPVLVRVKECEKNRHTQVAVCDHTTEINLLQFHPELTCADISFAAASQKGASITPNATGITYGYIDVGRDTVSYTITCDGIETTGTLVITVTQCPDYVTDIDCFVGPDKQIWSIAEERSTATGYSNYQGALVGDIDGDGIVEIVVVAGLEEGYVSNFWRPANTIAIFKGNDISEPYHSFKTKEKFGWECNRVFGLVRTKVGGIDSTLIVVLENKERLRAYNYNGEMVWESTKTIPFDIGQSDYRSPSFIDLNQDGIPEISVGGYLFNSSDGTFICEIPAGFPYNDDEEYNYTFVPKFGDLYNDGTMKMVMANYMYDININPVTNEIEGISLNKILKMPHPVSPEPPITDTLYWAVTLADMDNDGRLDVVLSFIDYSNVRQFLYIVDPVSNTIKAEAVLEAEFNGMPAIGDVDGCGFPEIVFVNGYDTDGDPDYESFLKCYTYKPNAGTLTELWSLVVDDASYETSITLFDFNGDGVLEICYRDHVHFRIIDGTTAGASLPERNKAVFQSYSQTGNEYPIIADIDGDGQAEIILVSGTLPPPALESKIGNLCVYKSANPHVSPWMPARPVWNSFNYHPCYVNNDLSVPAYPMNPAQFFPNGHQHSSGTVKQPFNNYMQQQTLLNQYGDPYLPAPNLVWTDPTGTILTEPVFTLEGDSITVEGCFKNIGDAAVQKPTYIAFYRNDSTTIHNPANLIALDSIPAFLMRDSIFCFKITLNDLSTLLSPGDSSIWVSINDKGTGKYPFQAQCHVDGRREFKLCTTLPFITLTKNSDNICVDGNYVLTGNIFGGTFVTSVEVATPNGTGSLSHISEFSPTDSLFTIQYIPDPADAGKIIKIAVTANAICGMVSDTLYLTVKTPPLLYLSETDVSVCAPDTVTLTGTFGGSATDIESVVIDGSGRAVPILKTLGNTFTIQYVPVLTDIGDTFTATVISNNPSGPQCTADVKSFDITVHPVPVVSVGSGDTSIPVGGNTTLFPAIGGEWTSDDPSVATVTADGIVEGKSSGTALMTFTDDNGCKGSILIEVSTELELGLTLFLEGVTQAPGFLDFVSFQDEYRDDLGIPDHTIPWMTSYLQHMRIPDIHVDMPDLKLPVNNPYNSSSYISGLSGSYANINDTLGVAGKIVDWILVEIWANFGPNINPLLTNYDLLEAKALLLKPDGSVVDTTGKKAKFTSYPDGNVHIVVRHRNHLAVMSQEVPFITNFDYSFADGVEQAYQSPNTTRPPMVMRHGVACLWAGELNLNPDHTLNNTDVTVYNLELGDYTAFGKYLKSDVTMDGLVNERDATFILDNAKRLINSPVFYFRKR